MQSVLFYTGMEGLKTQRGVLYFVIRSAPGERKKIEILYNKV